MSKDLIKWSELSRKLSGSENDPDWYNLSEEEQDEEIELLGCYLRTYDDIFNL